MNMTVRLAVPADAPDAAQIHARSWEVAYRDILPAEYIRQQSEKRPEQWKKILSAENATQYVIEKDGKTVGILCVAPPQVEEIEMIGDGGIDDSFYELHGIYLHPDHYRRGIGTAAMEFALEKARAAGKRNMILWVFAKNKNAIGFYEKCGFTADGASKIYCCGKEMKCIRMRRGV